MSPDDKCPNINCRIEIEKEFTKLTETKVSKTIFASIVSVLVVVGIAVGGWFISANTAVSSLNASRIQENRDSVASIRSDVRVILNDIADIKIQTEDLQKSILDKLDKLMNKMEGIK